MHVHRRVHVANEQNGLVAGFSMFWHRSDVKTVKVKNVPGVDEMLSYQGTFNLPAMHIYKFKRGTIHDIEAIGFYVALWAKVRLVMQEYDTTDSQRTAVNSWHPSRGAIQSWRTGTGNTSSPS